MAQGAGVRFWGVGATLTRRYAAALSQRERGDWGCAWGRPSPAATRLPSPRRRGGIWAARRMRARRRVGRDGGIGFPLPLGEDAAQRRVRVRGTTGALGPSPKKKHLHNFRRPVGRRGARRPIMALARRLDSRLRGNDGAGGGRFPAYAGRAATRARRFAAPLLSRASAPPCPRKREPTGAGS